MITANGIGSGIDVDGIVSQLMSIEREPVNRLQQKRDALDVELSAYGSVRSAMDTLAKDLGTLGDNGKIGPFVSTSSDEAVFTATASGNAAAGSHDIDVQSLAVAHRLASDAYADGDAEVGTGEWTFASGDNEFSITLASDEDSLAGLRDAINESSANDSIKASLLTTDDGTRLVLSALNTGLDNRITAQKAGSGGLIGGSAPTSPFTEVTAAGDASVLIDGFTVTSASNTISSAVQGIDIALHATGTATLDTQRDLDELDESLAGFVSNYNTMVTDLRKLSEDALQGDRLPRNAENSMRTAFGSAIELSDGTSVSPYDLGFTFDRYGTLSLDASRRGDAQQNLEKFIDAFSNKETGFAARLASTLDDFTQAGGRLDTRDDGVERRRSSLDAQIERYDYRLEQTEARYYRQFANMDALIGQLQSTSSFLADRLGGANN